MRERPLEDSAREGYKQANNKMQNKQKALRQCRENVKKSIRVKQHKIYNVCFKPNQIKYG